MRRTVLVLALAAAACSRRAAQNYQHCLKLRVGMTKAEMAAIMGAPETTIPFVEGKSLDYLKGRTAYEWSNPSDVLAPDHVSVTDATGLVQSIRCGQVEISAVKVVEPPEPSTSTVSGGAGTHGTRR